MGNTSSRTQRTYPRTIHLGNGTAMTLRLMSGADVDSLVSFARSLPVDDLRFLAYGHYRSAGRATVGGQY